MTLYLDDFLLDKRPDLGKPIERLVLVHPHQILHSAVGLQVSGVELKHHELEETAVSGHTLHHDGLLQNSGLFLQEDQRTSVCKLPFLLCYYCQTQVISINARSKYSKQSRNVIDMFFSK